MGRIDFSYRHFSIDELEEHGMQIRDEKPTPEEEYDRVGERETLLAALTEKQSLVFSMLAEGHTRQEIADHMRVCIQAVYQIDSRIKARLGRLRNIKPLNRVQKKRLRNQKELSRNAVYVLFLSNPEIKAERILPVWDLHPVLKCYYKPTLYELREWLAEYYNE